MAWLGLLAGMQDAGLNFQACKTYRSGMDNRSIVVWCKDDKSIVILYWDSLTIGVLLFLGLACVGFTKSICVGIGGR